MENNNNENKIRKIMFNEVSLIISIVAMIIGIYLTLTNLPFKNANDISLIQKDIEVIESNHLMTIQAQLIKNDEAHERFDERFDEIDKDLTEILTILNRN